MSLGLLSGYGSGSDSDNEEETATPSVQSPANDQLHERLKSLSDGLSLPPPPPPPSESLEPLPNPMKKVSTKPKQKSIPGMSKKEMELMMKNAKWTDIVTEEVTEEDKSDFEYNTPLPFSREQQPVEAPDDSGAGPCNPSASSQPEYDYLSYVAEYQNYMAQSAALMEGQERAKQLAQEAAAAGGGEGGDGAAGGDNVDSQYWSGSGQVWDEYMTKYSAWYNQYGAGTAGAQPVQPQLRQKTFEELLEQDRQLEAYFSSEPPNEYNTQRDAFKSSFRGTRRYRMLNGGNYNAKHFNSLSSGAKKFAEMYPKQKSVFEDKDAYVADKDLPENQDIKSNKQRKKDKWFQGMVDKKKGCKKCGFVFCRCYGWEFKPSHVK